jgi:hypothetical protein
MNKSNTHFLKLVSIFLSVLAVIATLYTLAAFIILVSPFSDFVDGGPLPWFVLPLFLVITIGLYWLRNHFRKMSQRGKHDQS